MDFNKIQTLIKINTHSSRWSRGIKYYSNKLVDNVGFHIDENTISFDGMVESEYNNEVYTSTILIDTQNYKILGGSCSCEDCRSKSDNSHLFLCKHLVATSISGIRLAKRDLESGLFENNSTNSYNSLLQTNNNNLTPSKQLLEYFNDSKREKVNLEVNLFVEHNKVFAHFKIGTDKMYVLKNIKDFAKSRFNNEKLEYGKNFIFDPNFHYFSSHDEKIIDMIEDYGMNIFPYSNSSYNSKIMDIGISSLKVFLELLENKDFNFFYNEEQYAPSIIKNSLPINFDIKKSDDKINLTSQGDLPIPITSKGDVLLYDENLYLLSNEDCRNYKKIFSVLNENKDISFEKEDTSDVLSSLVPKLKVFSNEVHLDEEIEKNIVSDFKPEFYFDLKNSKITCDLKFLYNDDNGKKYVLRNIQKEKTFEDAIVSYNFSKENKLFVFKGNDEDLFEFLNTQLSELKDLGDIYYSNKFKSKKMYNSTSINASIGKGLDGYLEFSFNLDDIDTKEYKNILNAFKNKRTFYKLKNGSFIDLRESKTKDFFELLENLDVIDSNLSKIHNNKAMYINEMLNQKNLSFINGKEMVNDICDRFKSIDDLNLDIPNNLNATLRDYQVSGMQWLNTLNHYNFGGILADEMGLGKTLQTIVFLLAQKNKKSLIITPTSLIYNWKIEFEKFAPSINVLLIHGSKKEREENFKNIDDYDVILTTYGTLRNDLDNYNNKIFDYCVIDEAQNIKNPIALSTEAVKSVNAKMRFALTGTPIENNLLELWSIFDFVMPGYLYNRNKFQNLFVNNEDNVENLKRLIKPFILRRTKKEVMKELPEKIEKNFFVELNKDQKKIYSTYILEIQEKMKSIDMKKDKITILSYLTKLRQLCLDPRVLLDNYTKKSSKIEACLEILEESIMHNHKILLFSQFTSVLKNLGDELKRNNISYSYLDGQTSAKDRLKLVDEFNETDESNVFLISLKAGGTGLNLTSADVVIHFDPWWNPAVEDQASDRAHRFGQKNVVEVIKLIAKGTIEEKILKLQENKKGLIDEFINGDLSNGNVLKSLSDTEIIELFS